MKIYQKWGRDYFTSRFSGKCHRSTLGKRQTDWFKVCERLENMHINKDVSKMRRKDSERKLKNI